MSGGLRPQGHLEPELGTGQCPGGSEPCRCCLSLAAQLRLARPSGGSGFWGRSAPLGLPQPALCPPPAPSPHPPSPEPDLPHAGRFLAQQPPSSRAQALEGSQ